MKKIKVFSLLAAVAAMTALSGCSEIIPQEALGSQLMEQEALQQEFQKNGGDLTEQQNDELQNEQQKEQQNDGLQQEQQTQQQNGQNQDNQQQSRQLQNSQQPAQSQNTSDGITAEQAKTIALKHAGIDSSDVMFIQAQEDRDDGQSVYDVEFYAGNQEYDYEILKSTGDILSYDYDIEEYSQTQGSGKVVSLEETKKNMLAKVSGAGEQNIRIWEDLDDGRITYEGEIFYNNVEYDFEVDASTGQILEWSSERLGY